MGKILIEKKKRKKRNNLKNVTVTYTTGDPVLNIKHFNKLMGTDFNNPSTEEAKEAANGVNKALSGDGSINMYTAGENASDGEFGSSEGVSMGEGLITEAKRNVRRYFVRPQNIFCSNKGEVLKTLIELENENCSVYTLKNLGDIKDTTKLTTKDIIYYYDNGILYDKNHVKVMDYDLYIKHEEERKKLPDNVSDSEFKKEYDDRVTELTDFDESLTESISTENTDLAMENSLRNKSLDELLKEAKTESPFDLSFNEDIETHTCCICGEEFSGNGNSPWPLKNDGICCDACNLKFVIPARMRVIDKQRNEEE